MAKPKEKKVTLNKDGTPRKPGSGSVKDRSWEEKFFELLVEGKSVSEICRMDGMPTTMCIYKRLRAESTFEASYRAAREIQAERFLDEIIQIADDGRNDWLEKLDDDGKKIGVILNAEHVARSRLRVDTRKWAMARMSPKKYSDKTIQEHVGAGGGPIQTQTTMTLNDFYAELGADAAESEKD